MIQADVINALPTLQKKELMQILALTKNLLGGSSQEEPMYANHTKEGTHERDVFFNVITEELFKAGDRCFSLTFLKKTQPDIYNTLQKHYVFIDEYSTRVFGVMDRNQKRRLFGLYINMVIDNLSDMKIPCGLNTVIRHLGRVPALVDIAFPGYLASGLQNIILRQLAQPPDQAH